jgi:large-conductance mechanosensitive channel
VPVTKARAKYGPTAEEEAEAEELVLLREIRDALQSR